MQLLQALPGSRLDTSLFQDWLLKTLASLHSYQTSVAAAEAVSRQKRHAAAAAAAVRAVELGLQAATGNDAASKELGLGQLHDGATFPPPHDTQPAALYLPAAVTQAAASATSAISPQPVDTDDALEAAHMSGHPSPALDSTQHSASSAVQQSKKQNLLPQAVSHSAGQHSKKPELFPQAGLHSVGQHAKKQALSPQAVSRSAAGQLCLDLPSCMHLNPLPLKTSYDAAEGKPEAGELVAAYLRDAIRDPQGFVCEEVVKKQLEVLSVCFNGLCREVCMRSASSCMTPNHP